MSLDNQTNRLLGYSAETRLLILDADDFGAHLTVISEWRDYRRGPLTPKEKVQSQGLPSSDYDFWDSYLELWRQLPAGLSAWAVHPGIDNTELKAIDPGGSFIRQADFNFLTAPQVKDFIEEEGIVLLDYHAL